MKQTPRLISPFALAAVFLWLPGGASALGPVLGPSPLESLTLSGEAYATGGLVAVTDGYFVQALEVETFSQPTATDAVALSAPTAAAIQRDDLLALQFYSRTISATTGDGKGRLRVVFDDPGGLAVPALDALIVEGAAWNLHSFLFRANANFASGQARFSFHLGFPPQTIQIVGLRLSNLGQPIAESPPLSSYYTFGDTSVTVVPVTGQTFNEALRVETRSKPAERWNAQLLPNPQVFPADAIASDDVFCLVFQARTISSTHPSGRATVNPVLERSTDYRKSLEMSVRPGNEWHQYVVPFEGSYDYAAGEARFKFFIGYEPQVFEVGDIRIYPLHQTVDVDDLPRDVAFFYEGRDPAAPWRAEADAAIRQYRKAELEIEVLDADGVPIPGADVQVTMTRHAFRFGSAVNLQRLTDLAPTYETYRQKFLELFNSAVDENDLKWPPWEGDWGGAFTKARSLAGLAWLQDHDIYVRGHCMVWPSYNHVAQSARALWDQPSLLRPHVLAHIEDIGSSTAAFCNDWDVINEPYTNHDLMDMFGNDVMVDWFIKAQEVAPASQLYVNDYAILASGGSTDTAHQQGYYDILDFLIDRGAPLGGIGMQAHFGAAAITPPPVLWQILDRFTTFGLPISVTEFDVGTYDELADADYLRDFMTAVFAHPSVTAFLQWGFWEGQHYSKDRALYRSDWSAKPSGVTYERLLFNDWWTQSEGTTNGTGRYRVNDKAFKGRYDVSAAFAGTSTTLEGVEVIDDRTGSQRVVVQLDGVRLEETRTARWPLYE